jgi:predicted anti-sigma-YlaC factor YlaD
MADGGHPASHRLDHLALGDRDPQAERHVAGCEECRGYIERAAAAAAQFAAAAGPSSAAFAQATRQRLTRRRRATVLGGLGAVAAAALVLVFILPHAEPPVRFKGGPQLAVVRDRAGVQARAAAAVSVRAGDRLRVEVSLDQPGEVGVAFLGEDGSWVVLLAPRRLPPGTHWSEQALRFDDHPTAGVILAGAPDALAKRRRSDLSTLEVRVEPATR